MSKKHFLIGTVLIALFCSCQEDFDHHLKSEAISFTRKHCPQNIEAGNTLDSVTYDITTRTYTQWFTFDDFLDSPEAHKAALNNIDKLKSQLQTVLRGDTKWETCKDNSINFRYVYISHRKKDVLFQITLTPNDYRR